LKLHLEQKKIYEETIDWLKSTIEKLNDSASAKFTAELKLAEIYHSYGLHLKHHAELI
jgi:hypothetical protein